MSGTTMGGLKAREKNLARDPDFYKKIGSKGGKNGNTGGFYANRELARLAGAKGGSISRRGPKENTWRKSEKALPLPEMQKNKVLRVANIRRLLHIGSR